ncbi:DNA-binding domain-containing protein [Flavobacterium paronense]|uniref:DNA-binding domain-containing protein n=1 Tax=Flavobacterium paronense TaxID=1392775 RepID=A0ABV5GCR8_9FLAO|nr:DNA-binding domain-containing protein [Flavobacterium paronense]MDN3676279.1 DNA-binding domain-containing protein [Flavobacterium paronense]
MAIKYYLQPNPITPDPNDQSARVISNKVHDTDSITKEMLKRGSTITEADIRAVLNVFFMVVTDEVADGNSVNLPLVNIRAGVTGVFTSITDSFDASRHIKKANLSAGTELIRKMNEARVEKITVPTAAPALIAFTDVTSQTTNSILTPGGIGQIVGEELKFNPANVTEGIFFIASDGTVTPATIIASRTEGKIVFSVPALPAGNYTLEVRKGYGSTNIVVRSGALQDTLIVN